MPLHDFEMTFLGEGEDVAFRLFLSCFVYRLYYIVGEVRRQIFLFSKL